MDGKGGIVRWAYFRVCRGQTLVRGSYIIVKLGLSKEGRFEQAMDESLHELIENVEVDTSAFKRENDGVDGGVGKRVRGDAESGGNCKGADFSTLPLSFSFGLSLSPSSPGPIFYLPQLY